MGTRFVASAESLAHQHFKQAIVAAEATGTQVPDKQSTPRIGASKTRRTQAIFEAGLMPGDTFASIQQLYFDGDMEAAPALADLSADLIHAGRRCSRSSTRRSQSSTPSRRGSGRWVGRTFG